MEIQTAEYPIRYFILMLYSLSACCNAMIWITPSPILSIISDVISTKTYDVPIIWVEMCLISFMIIYIIIVFPCGYLIEIYGLRIGILIAVIVTTIGAWVRVGAYDDFWCILIGSSISALGQPFLLNSPSKVAETWFRPDRRTIATTFGTMANYIGVIIGFALPAVLVRSDESKNKIGNLMLTQAVFCTVVCLLCIVWFKDKPELPPSITASEEREAFCSSLSSCMKNLNFDLINLSSSLLQGAIGALATLLDPITDPYNFSSTDNSVIGIVLIICGIIGSFIIGVEVTLTNKYKLSFFICTLLSLITLVIFTFTLELESLIVTACVIGLFGLVVTPCIPISYEYGVEVTYPVDESTSVGLMNTGAQAFGIVMIGIGFIFNNDSFAICFVCVVSLAIAAVCVLLSKEELKRSGVDNKKFG